MSRSFPFFIILLAAALTACGGADETGECSGPVVPKDVPGLEIKGPRTKANVIANMVGPVIQMRKIYKEHCAKNPDLEGCIEFILTVESHGEVAQIEVGRSTIYDRSFEKAVMRPLQFMDFDGWSGSEEETQIIYPVEFED